jgi:hypothetical protein
MIHEEKAEQSNWVKLIYIIPAGLFIGALASLFYGELEPFWVLIGDSALVSLIFYFIFPRKFQIFNNRIRIVLGNPLAINILFSSIKEVRHTEGSRAYVYSGVRLATSSSYVIEISRVKGLNYVISPQHGELFLQQLKQAIESRDV